MECKIIIITLLCCFGINYISCHLKDMGEKKGNWTQHILQDIEKKVLGGKPTTLKQFPFNVQFFNFGSLCGGNILTKKTVLTAAHCFDHNTNIAEMIIVSNPRFVFDRHADSHEVWDYKIHENYSEPAIFANDIGILIIHDSFVFSDHVQKIMVTTTFTWMRENETFIATGWGETKNGKDVANNSLNKVRLTYVNKEKCMELNRIVLSPDMFCLHGDGVRDTCRGDSGGGILWKGVLVGITSHGRGCGELPGMYVNVYYLNKWIQDTVALLTNKYCVFHNTRI